MSVCLLDTSILCELLKIPDHCHRPAEVGADFIQKRQKDETILLPMSTLVEAGNHIGHIRDGRQRRITAEKFLSLAQEALQGKTPFASTRFFQRDEFEKWLKDFPDWTNQGSGLGDLTIVKEWERQCMLNRARHVYIWSLDRHLSAYDRKP